MIATTLKNKPVSLLGRFTSSGSMQLVCMAGITNESKFAFGTSKKLVYKSDNSAYSKKYQQGLFHMKTHGQRRQRCFSMKWSLHTMKPNIIRKTLHSEILNQTFRIWISQKARRCIVKKGSLDKYLLNSNPKHIDSKFGILLRDLIQQRLTHGPNFRVPYIPGQYNAPKNRRTQYWEYQGIPSIYLSQEKKNSVDQSPFYLKTPQEMSRHELAELEAELRELEQEDMEDLKIEKAQEQSRIDAGEVLPDEEAQYGSDDDVLLQLRRQKQEEKKQTDQEDALEAVNFSPELLEKKPEDLTNAEEELMDPKLAMYRNHMRNLLPLRRGIIRRYFHKFKYQKNKRTEILAAAMETEPWLEDFMRDEYVPLLDQMPEVKKFLHEIEKKEAQKLAEMTAQNLIIVKKQDYTVPQNLMDRAKLLHPEISRKVEVIEEDEGQSEEIDEKIVEDMERLRFEDDSEKEFKLVEKAVQQLRENGINKPTSGRNFKGKKTSGSKRR